MPKTQTKQRPKADTSARARIIREARKRFASSGFDGASTRQIAEDAGVAQSLLLYHFGSKDILWKAVMDDTFAFARQTTDRVMALEEPASTKDRLIVSVRAFIQICREMPDLHRLMTLEGRSKTDRLVWLTQTHLKPMFAESVKMISKAQKEGVVKAGDPALIHYGIIAIAGMAYAFAPEISLLTGRRQNPDPSDVEELVGAFLFSSQQAIC